MREWIYDIRLRYMFADLRNVGIGTGGLVLALGCRMERLECIHIWEFNRRRAACCRVLSGTVIRCTSMQSGQCGP